MEFLDQLLGWLATASGLSSSLAVLLEVVFRFIPSEKPLSIAHLVSALVRKVSDVLEGLANLLDDILPQKLASPPPEEK